MGQDIHIHLQDGTRAIDGRTRVGRDGFLFGLFGLAHSIDHHPATHEPNGMPGRLAPEVAEILLVPAPEAMPGATRYRRFADGRLVEDPAGPLAEHPDWHTVGHMDAGALEEILRVWSASVDYGWTRVRPVDVSDPCSPEDPEIEAAIAATFGPEVEVPWFEDWMGMPGPEVNGPSQLVRLVMRGAMERRLFEPALIGLQQHGSLRVARYANRPPEMGDAWRPRGPHPTLAPLLALMRAREAAGGAPQLVVFFDN